MSEFTDQKKICARFAADFLPFDPMEKVGIALHTLEVLPLNALRHKPEGGVCGWYIWGGEYSDVPDFFAPLHVAHLGQLCDAIVPYLGLAAGWRVQLAPEHEDVWFDGALLNE